MADQSVKITSLPDSGSVEAVALKLFEHLRNASMAKAEQLSLYAECLFVVRGYTPSHAASHSQG